jgi:HK97 family phage major capsid protein
MKKLVIPEKPEELAELLADDKRRSEVFGSAEATKDFLAQYVKATNKAGEVAKIVGEQVQEQLTAFLKEQGINRPNLTPQNLPVDTKGYNPRAVGAQLDNLFESHADYFKATWHMNPNRDSDERVRKIRAYSSGVPSEGGFLIPESLRSEMLRVALEASIVRARARVIPMESLTVPFPLIDSTTNVGGVYGGVVCSWCEEGQEAKGSEAKFGRAVLQAKKLVAYTEVPNELISDSIISFETFLSTMFPEAIAFEEDYAFLTGNGVGQPQGVLNSPALISVTRDTAATIKWADIVAMYARMLPASLGRAIFVASIDTFPALAQMSLEVGLGGSAVWLNNGAAGPPVTILGRPVIFTEKVPTLGDPNDICFLDLGYYLIGDRQTMYQSSSPHFRFSSGVTAYLVTERVDGRGWLNSAITPRNAGASLSPFVGLGTV